MADSVMQKKSIIVLTCSSTHFVNSTTTEEQEPSMFEMKPFSVWHFFIASFKFSQPGCRFAVFFLAIEGFLSATEYVEKDWLLFSEDVVMLHNKLELFYAFVIKYQA